MQKNGSETYKTQYENLPFRTAKREKKINENGLRDLWDNVKHTNIHMIGVPEKDRKKGRKKILEKIKA